MKKALLCLMFSVVFGGFVFAGPPASITSSWDSGDALVVDKSSPAAFKMQIGSRLYGPVGIVGTTTYAANDNGNPSVYATPTTSVFLKTTGAVRGESYKLGNGVQNQQLTIVLVTDGGNDFYVTPLTKTGFTSAQLNDAKDSVTLRYVDDTTGWVVSGNNGATIN